MESLDHAGLVPRLLEHAEGGESLPDGRAEEASPAGWETLLRKLWNGDGPTTWSEGEGRFPASVDDLTDDAFSIGFVRVSAHVTVNLYASWGTEAVFFHFSSREMRSQEDVDALSGFVRVLVRTVGGPVKLSSEGDDDEVLAVYDPGNDEFRWTHSS